MNGRGLSATRMSSLVLVLALAACGSSSSQTNPVEFSGVTPAPASDSVSSRSDTSASNVDPSPSGDSVPSPDSNSNASGEEMVGIIPGPIANAEDSAGGESADDGSEAMTDADPAAGAGDMANPSPQLWEQKRAALLDIIGRPQVALDPVETPLPDDAGLSVRDFSIATDGTTRINGTIFAPHSDGPLPAVVYLHGTGGSRQDGFGLLRTLAQRGFFALAIDARHHGPGVGDRPYFDAIAAAYGSGEGHPFLYDSVWDVLRLLDYLEQRPEVDATRIGLVGNSKGGMETYLSAAIDPRIAVAVPWISVQSFAWALDNNQWQARVGSIQGAVDQAAAQDNRSIDVEFVRQFYARLVPGITAEFDGPAMVAAIAPRPLLAVNGDSDPRTPMGGLMLCEASARAAYASAADHFALYLQPNTGHAVTAEATTRTVDWLVQWLE